MKYVAIPLIFTLILAAGAHARAGLGPIECRQNRNVALGRGSSVTVSLRPVGRSREYKINVTEARRNGSVQVMADEPARLATAERIAFFKGRKTELTLPLEDAGQSFLKIGSRRINLTCENL